MGIEIEGFDDLSDQLSELQENAESVDGENEVSVEELFTEGFMTTHTDCKSFEQFIEQSPWTVKSQQDFEEIPEDKFDKYVDSHTGFSTWEAMMSAAAREWVTRQLGL